MAVNNRSRDFFGRRMESFVDYCNGGVWFVDGFYDENSIEREIVKKMAIELNALIFSADGYVDWIEVQQ